MNKIPLEWRVTEQHLKQELVSADERWHISRSQKGKTPSQFFLSNYDLLLTPHGIGTNYVQCFETFISNCDDFMEKLAGIREEAQEHLEWLKTAGEKRLEDEGLAD